MTINLTTAAPTDDAESLTAGGNYSIWHRGGIAVSALIGDVDTTLYTSLSTGGVVLMGIPQTTLTLTLAAGETAATVELNALA
jgi:hypothetical protein